MYAHIGLCEPAWVWSARIRRRVSPNLPYCTIQALLIGQDTHKLDLLTKSFAMITRTKDFSILMYFRSFPPLPFQAWTTDTFSVVVTEYMRATIFYNE